MMEVGGEIVVVRGFLVPVTLSRCSREYKLASWQALQDDFGI
jgi:hypothetical protein